MFDNADRIRRGYVSITQSCQQGEMVSATVWRINVDKIKVHTSEGRNSVGSISRNDGNGRNNTKELGIVGEAGASLTV